MSAHERFSRWISDLGLSREQAGQFIGCHKSMVSLLCTQRRRPGLDLAFKIERLSEGWEEGPIRVAEWSPEGRLCDRLKGVA